MIDTGNDTRPAGLVISKDMYLELKLAMVPVKPRRVNTAARGASMAMLGYIQELVLSVGGTDQTFRVEGVPVLDGGTLPSLECGVDLSAAAVCYHFYDPKGRYPPVWRE